MKLVAELATGLDLIRARAASVLDPDQLEDIDDLADRVDERRGFPGDTFVVALAGGTGAGKSSLINAIAGEAVTSVSPIRPHTDRPFALVPVEPDADLEGFLDDMGIFDRASVARFTDLAVIDLPDQDSIAMSHREIVWDVLPEVDAIVWVADPDKYHDDAFLSDYVAGLAAYQDQTLFVLNKVDLLDEDALEEVEADFIGQLEIAGIVEPRVFKIAADPPHRSPIGVDGLVSHLEQDMVAKTVLASKTVADIARAVDLVARRAGVHRGWALGFDERWQATATEATAATDDGDDERAVAVIEAFKVSLVGDVGPGFGRRIIAAVPLGEVARVVAAGQIGDVGEQLRALLWDRAYLGATLAAVGVQAAQAQARLAR